MEILAFFGGMALLAVGLGIMVLLICKARSYTPGDDYRNTIRVPSEPPMWTYHKVTYGPPPTEAHVIDEQL